MAMHTRQGKPEEAGKLVLEEEAKWASERHIHMLQKAVKELVWQNGVTWIQTSLDPEPYIENYVKKLQDLHPLLNFGVLNCFDMIGG